MPKITFLPDNIEIERPAGSSLLEAARLAGVFVETPCGGKGTCQKCRVRITANGEQYALLCQAAVPDEAVTVALPASLYAPGLRPGENRFETLYEDMSVNLRGNREMFLKNVFFQVPPPALLDGLSDADRFSRAFLKTTECASVELPLNVVTVLPEKLREADGKVLVFYYIDNNIAKVINIIARSLPSALRHGVAVDIGTTTVDLWLVDLENGKVLAALNAYNSQVECALDVIGRINYAKKFLPDLRMRVLNTINELLSGACANAGVDPAGIMCVSLAGNTTMTHLLLGIMPEYIRLAPYTPAVFCPQVYTAGQLGISACDNAPVLFAPAVGSYVGGDITAGLLCTSLAACNGQTDTLVLFIDIGTNGEIVLGNRDFIFACACSAGPAFEGGGIKHGIRACAGAVERVAIKDGKPEVYTIGGAPPVGICGSGIISAIAEMFRKGIIDSAGKFADPAYVKKGEYILHDAEPQGISISETDINNFIRAKGAIFSACQTMLDSVGMSFGDVGRVYVAGGFGRFLDLEDARTVGLLPRLPDEKFTFLGNSSVTGACLTMVCEDFRIKEHQLAGTITYVDLSNEPKYMDHYTGALFLPHTDRKLFD